MANKKFYYRNKNKKPQTSGADVAADTLYTAEQLSRTLSELGISESTCETLSKYRINNAGDLVKRTEKDMYKVQGFNKKMLFEVKDALRNADMSLKAETPKVQPAAAKVAQSEESKNSNQQQKQSNSKQSNGKDDKRRNAPKADKQERSSKFGLADRRGDTKQKPQSQNSQSQPQRVQKTEKLTAPLTIENWRKIMKGGKWGFSDGFKTVIPAMYDEVFGFKEGLASVEIDGKCGYIDGQNNIVIPLDYDIAMSFSDGLAMVARGEKCGYINKNNELIVPFEYDAATPFEDGEAKVKKDGKWATLTKDNKLTWI